MKNFNETRDEKTTWEKNPWSILVYVDRLINFLEYKNARIDNVNINIIKRKKFSLGV